MPSGKMLVLLSLPPALGESKGSQRWVPARGKQALYLLWRGCHAGKPCLSQSWEW